MRVVLVALSAKQIHKTLAPWCLKAYCDAHIPNSDVTVFESTINDAVGSVVQALFLSKPDVVGFSCYIWNIEHTVKIAKTLKKVLPDCAIVLGGPEVSFETDGSRYPFADCIIQGAGEMAFAQLLRSLEEGNAPGKRIIKAQHDEAFSSLPSPYTRDYFASFEQGGRSLIENQLIYYESSRGCPFSCTYCLSSTTFGVSELSLQRAMGEIDALLAHGAKCIKFVDRTFNANRKRAMSILHYVLSLQTDCTFHFEVAADLFDADMLELIAQMPPKRVQFEMGVQSVNASTLAAVNRKTDIEKVFLNIAALVRLQNCHIHVDLIAGLPHDSLATFIEGINRCLRVRPHMLQLGFLKMLKGSKIRANTLHSDYVFSDFPPYEVLRSDSMSFADIIELKRVEEVIDKYYNSGMFVHSVQYAIEQVFGDGYAFFHALSLHCEESRRWKASLKTAYTILFDFLLSRGEKSAVEHYMKLDCLTHDTKGLLPDSIPSCRDKAAENEIRRNSQGEIKNIRVEYFPFDNRSRAFLYDRKDPITRAHEVLIWPDGKA